MRSAAIVTFYSYLLQERVSSLMLWHLPLKSREQCGKVSNQDEYSLGHYNAQKKEKTRTQEKRKKPDDELNGDFFGRKVDAIVCNRFIVNNEKMDTIILC